MEEDKRPHYIEGVGWRYDKKPSMLRRMENHDYRSRCIYMLTLTLANRRQHLFGEVVAQAGPVHGSSVSSVHGSSAAVFVPTPLGLQVETAWRSLPQRYPQVKILRVQLMPEHLHVVIFVREQLPLPLGKLVGVVKSRCNAHYWAQLTAQGMLKPKGEEAPPPLFSENFQDSILMHEGQLERMLQYVDENPYRALVKRENPLYFQVVTNLEAHGRKYAAIGNRWLLNRPMLLQVRCHNNATPENLLLIEKQKTYFLDRCRKGAVLVSPCISEGEKQIARAALEEGLPLVVLLENGFTPMYKPQGKYFEACASGLLLMLAPWPYHTERRTISRQKCDELNTMAKELSTEPWTSELETQISRAY